MGLISVADDVDLYVEVYGEGPPLLNISGTGNDLRVSRPDATPLNEHFAVCHYDQRGLGQSSKPDRPYTMADYADDAAALITAQGWERAHVVGTSFGGMVAQNLVARHPGVVDRLVLACTSAGGVGGPSADLLALSKLPEAESLKIRGKLLDTRNNFETGEMAPGMDTIIAYMGNRSEVEMSEVDQMGARRQLEARGGHDTSGALSGFTCPTLVIGGRYDGIAPPENLEYLAANIPDAELAWCEGGHIFMLQDPTAWPTIINFLTT
jgi:3-oxoadipate enol-lactonase